MTTSLIRMRNAAVAVKIETTNGTDAIAGTPASGDWLQADCTIALNPVAIENPGYTGSLDTAVASIGGFRPTLTLRVPLRGSGTAGTAPTLGRLLQACTMALTETDSAVGAPTAAAAGGTTTAQAASPFGTTADAYNAMPLSVAGDQAFITGIVDYAADRTISFGETRADALTTSSTLQIPINDRYGPTSDETVFKAATVYVFYDGIRYKFVGAQGTVSLELTAGGSGMLTFTMSAQLAADPDNTALPAGAAAAFAALPAMPRWVEGRSQLNRRTARCRTLRIDWGVQTVLPDNPEAAQGFDPAVPIGRRIAGTLDPYIDTATNTALFTAMEAGTNAPYIAILGATAGNRILVTMPGVRLLDLSPSERDGLGQFSIPFQADGPDAGAYITFF
jgi:hypothetical protein